MLCFLVKKPNEKEFRRHQHLSAGTECFAMTAASHDGANRQRSVHACWKLADLVAYPHVQTNPASSLTAKLLGMQPGSSEIKQVPSVLDACFHSCEDIHAALSAFIKLLELWICVCVWTGFVQISEQISVLRGNCPWVHRLWAWPGAADSPLVS